MVWEWKKTKIEDSGASTQGPKHHQPGKGGGPTVKGIQRVWFGGGGEEGLYLVSSLAFFWEYTLMGMVSHPKEVVDGWDHLMHTIEVGGEVAQSLSIWTKR